MINQAILGAAECVQPGDSGAPCAVGLLRGLQGELCPSSEIALGWESAKSCLSSVCPAALCSSHTWDGSLLPPLPGVHPHTAWHILLETESIEEQRDVRGGEVEKFSSLEDCFKAKKWKTKIPQWETPWRISENEAK